MFQGILDDKVKCDVGPQAAPQLLINTEIRGPQVDSRSKLLNYTEDLKTIEKWFGGANISLNLLYSKSRDGCNSDLAKQRIHNKVNIFAVINSTTGKVHGGFSSTGFKYLNSRWMSYDGEAFLFSLNKGIKLLPKSTSFHIINGPDLILGWTDLLLMNDCTLKHDLGWYF